MEYNKKTGIKGWWEKYKGKVKVGATAVAAFTVGVLLTKPSKDEYNAINKMRAMGKNLVNGDSFATGFTKCADGCNSSFTLDTYGRENSSVSALLDEAKEAYTTDIGLDPNTAEATGLIVFWKN